MSPEAKIARVEQWLACHHLHFAGGYPYATATHAGRLFVASLDHDEATSIESYDLETLVRWYDAASKYLTETRQSKKWPTHESDDYGNWDEAFGETHPDQDQ